MPVRREISSSLETTSSRSFSPSRRRMASYSVSAVSSMAFRPSASALLSSSRRSVLSTSGRRQMPMSVMSFSRPYFSLTAPSASI